MSQGRTDFKVLKKELWVGRRKAEKLGEGGGVRGKIVILFTSTSTQIPNYKTSPSLPPKKKDISK